MSRAPALQAVEGPRLWRSSTALAELVAVQNS